MVSLSCIWQQARFASRLERVGVDGSLEPGLNREAHKSAQWPLCSQPSPLVMVPGCTTRRWQSRTSQPKSCTGPVAVNSEDVEEDAKRMSRDPCGRGLIYAALCAFGATELKEAYRVTGGSHFKMITKTPSYYILSTPKSSTKRSEFWN